MKKMDVLPAFVALLLGGLLLLTLFILSTTTSRRKRKRKPCLPPSPAGLPLLGHLPLLGSLPHRKLQAMAEVHGPVMLLRLGRVPTVVASSSAAAQEAMKTRDLAFASRAPSAMATRLLYGRDMVFAPYGEFWRQARRVSVVHLLSPRRVQSLSFRRAREHEAAALLRRIHIHVNSSSGVVNLSHLLISYARGVISRAVFGNHDYELDLDGEEDGGGGKKLRKVFEDFEALLGTGTVGEFVPWLAWVDTVTGLHARATRTFRALDSLLDRVLADHLAAKRRRDGRLTMVGDEDDDDEHRQDFVDVLLDVKEAEEKAGGEVQFDTTAIKAIILDMFAASIDTTHTTLEWAMAELINHPHQMRKLQTEIRAAVAAAGEVVTEEHLEKLPYLQCVIKETLRLHAPVPLLVPRQTLEDTELLGYHVPARTRVVINAWAIGRDRATWGHDADEFVPERFEEDDDVLNIVGGQQDDFRFVPFGAGRRGCPGAGFAVPSIELVLATLLYHFDWELPPPAANTGGVASSTLDMTELYGLSVRLKATLNLVAKPWSPRLST
ncbi:hypothetical protein PR202_ga24255 [Eleusine coracana subsp. coracana]|uniref:Uncharacterized protein n=1 Tax=Eleusine coracana subsp. coracana TaxID=191504 RepID=A0AAV5D8S7_ELECO|nr:hypothetical protein QOZ80_1BG0049500 [Eleusine coracana subsp. coracana]GJN06522.1 hypothetical protein PR202_ga24255 [Eleusine coracana subsp. coracana]